MAPVQKSAFDLVACEQEPIDRPQSIQSPCALIMFDMETGKLALGSDNLEELFGKPLLELLGAKASELFEPADAAALDAMMCSAEKPISRYLQLRGRSEHFVRVFESEGLLGVELNAWEDARDQPIQLGLDIGNTLQAIEEKAQQLTEANDDDLRNLSQFIADEFRKSSGYDRSMVYRFDTDWNGEVIAESRSDAAPGSFLGLSFPSSDIPAQARRLFMLNRVRPVIDIERGSTQLLPANNPLTGKPVDLSDCSVRAVSPVHVEYLQNMGVRATLNIALVARNRLWGLLSNHHYSAPYRLTPARAATCRLLAEVFSAELTRIMESSEAAATTRVRDNLRRLRKEMFEGGPQHSMQSLLAGNEAGLLSELDCDGMSIFVKENQYNFGETPDADLICEVVERTKVLMAETGENTFSTHFAGGLWPDLAERLQGAAAGVFACSFPDASSRLILYRKPRETQVTWGGDPHKRINPGAEERLHPRKSFEKFVENVRDRAVPWEHNVAAKARECVIGFAELDWLLAWRSAEMELAASRAQVEHAAFHDALTDLPNRRYLTEVMDKGKSRAAGWSAVLHLDLDGFKQINDTHGHATGDEVLMEVATRLRSQTDPEDFCARIGGDEFVVLAGSGKSEKDVQALGERLVNAMSHSVVVNGERCEFGTSVGYVLIADQSLSSEQLLAQADIALYESKRSGRGRVTPFSEELDSRIRRAQKLGEEILAGLRGGQFVPWYQPQFDANTLELCGVEALMRWEHPEHGTLTPDKFIKVAEDSGHLATLDAIAMERALADYHRWQAAGLAVPTVSLNLSYERLSDPDLVKSVKAAGLPPEVFAFELLESIYLDEVSKAVEWNIDLLRELGLKLEIDDFGTGRTSIVSLVKLRPNRLKIDRQLVMPIVESAQSLQLVSSIVEIGRSLNIGITAEGVETMEHANLLRDLGCSVLQGYALARPMPSEELMAFIEDKARKSA